MKTAAVLSVLVVTLIVSLVLWQRPKLWPALIISIISPSSSSAPVADHNASPLSTSHPAVGLIQPIADFETRITKKRFGTYVTPTNSPVQPERFTGYHTGVDVEYGDIASDVPVVAVADGTIAASQTVNGYGGALMLEIELNNQPHRVIYGHLRPSSLPAVGQMIKQGERLAVLGTAYSAETDGERRHLHFAILSNNRLDWRGYVQSKAELAGWLDPLNLYR